MEEILDWEAKSTFGDTPLSLAAQRGHEAIVKLLLEKGAGLGARDDDAKALLFYAVGEGHEAIVKLLLENGAG